MIASCVLQRYLHLPIVKREVRIDYLGAVLITVAAQPAADLGLVRGHDFAWMSWQIGAVLGGTRVLGVLAVWSRPRRRSRWSR